MKSNQNEVIGIDAVLSIVVPHAFLTLLKRVGVGVVVGVMVGVIVGVGVIV